jgi:hypothetical protein
MDETPDQLEKTYSRNRSYLKEGLEHEATPVALVRSVTQRSRRMWTRALHISYQTY